LSEAQERKAARRRFHVVRWVVLVLVLVISTVIGLLHQKMPGLRLVGVDALCPFGGVESLWALLASGAMLKKIAAGSFILLGASVVLNLVAGRAFCGQFCPLGTLQELFGSLRNRLRLARMEIPQAIDVPARFLKYLVFGVFAWLSWLTGTLAIRPYDPWVAYHHLTSPELLTNFGVGAAILVISLVGSLLYDRFFCKYLCPMGAFLGLFNKLGLYQVTRHVDACIDCGACDRVCPVNIEVSAIPETLSDSECIACGECVAACPKAEALTFETRTRKVMRPVVLTAATTTFMVAVIAISVAAGAMSFFNKPLAQQVGGAAAPVLATAPSATFDATAPAMSTSNPMASSSSAAVPFDTSLIKGYMTIAEIAPATGIPTQEFIAALGITQAELTTPLKEMKYAHDFDTQAVRDFVADRLGVPRSEPEACQ
jgi:polyferredoxin